MSFVINSYRFGSAPSYLLDTYTGAAAAYSLRQLKTGVTNVVRVRRSSDNTESDFTAAQVTDGTLTTWTGANNGFVVTWYDQSGNGRNATQSTAENQPLIVESGTLVTFLGKPHVKYNDNADALITSAFSAAGNNRSYFVVSKMITNSNQNLMLIEHNRGGSDAYRNGIGKYFSTANLMQAQIGTGTTNIRTNTSTLNTTDDYLFSAFAESGTYLRFYQNGSLVHDLSTTGVPVIDASSSLSIGRTTGTGTAQYLIAEGIYWSGTNQINNRAGIESNINAHYGIY